MDIPGCFAEELAAPEEAFTVITPRISDREAAVIQPLASIVAAIRSAVPPTQSAVVVFGLGVMGLFAVQAIRAQWQPMTVIGISRRRAARELALKLGADVTLAFDDHVEAKAHLAALGRDGADVVFDCSGNPEMAGPGPSPTVQAAVELLDPNRQLVEVATFTQSLQIDAGAFHRKSIRYIFPSYTTLSDLETAVELVSSRAVKVTPLLGPIFDGIESLPRALQAIRERGAEFGLVQVRARLTEAA
jgi:threonine dehydrogenase-like Zn-dependent dehydrogenase